jgi:hypothetical protein
MKKTLRLFALLLIAASAAANTVVVPVYNVCPSNPQNCASLSAALGITVTQIDIANFQATITCSPDWTPSSAQLTQLQNLLNAGQPLTILTQPQNQTATTGGNVSFTVAANAPNPTYQWQFAGTPIVGATNATLTLINVQSANAGNYSVVVTNAGITDTSGNATLTVNSP